MQAIKDITLQLSAETERQLTDRIAWFYLRHLNDADAKPAAALNQLLTRGERAELPEAQGTKEKEARSGPCTRKALLEAQLYDTISSYTKQFEMRDDGIPQSLRRQMNGRLSSFNEQAARKLAENAMNCIRQGGSAAQTVQEMLTVFDKAVKRFAGDVDTAYTQASWYCLIKEYENEGHHRFRYVVEEKKGLCDACLRQSDQTYTLAELLKQNLLPPLHPNCRCALVPDDELPAADDRDAGGFASRRMRAEGKWYDALLRIPADAKKLVSGVMAAQQERLHRGTLAGFADWFTLGIVSGAWNGMNERFAALTDDPSLYTALDWATMGSAGMVKRAVAPEEPLSLEHWLNALGVASLALGAYQMARNYARVSVDDVAAFDKAVAANEPLTYNYYALEATSEDSLIVRDVKYLDKHGYISWKKVAPHNGFVKGTERIEMLPEHFIIDRYGGTGGKFAAPFGTPYEMRSLPYFENVHAYHVYRVVTPIQVKTGKIAPAFNLPGGGIQYQLPMSIGKLIEKGYLEVLTP